MTQATDGDIDRAIECITVHTAQLLQDLVTIQHFTGITGQQYQRRKLIGRQIKGVAIQQSNAFIQIDGQPFKREDLIVNLLLAAAQNRLNASHQLTGFKGFCQVVIGPKLQPGADVHVATDYEPIAVEIRDLLEEAGFSEVEVYWEGADDDGGTGCGPVAAKASAAPSSPARTI